VPFHLAEIAVVTDMIAHPVLFQVDVLLFLAGEFFHRRKGFQYRTRVVFPTADVIDLTASRCVTESDYEISHILRVDVVTYLLALVSENLVLAFFDFSAYQIAQKAM